MKTLSVNGYDMAYLEVGNGSPLVCIHGSLGDFRTWFPVLGPLSKKHRVFSPSLRRFFPEHWDGVGNDYLIAQHVADVIGLIEKLNAGPVDLIGHSRGGHIAFRVAGQRPDLLRKLILAEPGGELENTLDPAAFQGSAKRAATFAAVAGKIAAGDVEGGLVDFYDTIAGAGAWSRLPAAPKQQLRDNAYTLVGQAHENRQPYRKAEAEALSMPTLFIGGGDTQGPLPALLRTLASLVPGARVAIVPNARHWMFEQEPQIFCDIVLGFLAER